MQERVKMKQRPAGERTKDFKEVSRGYSPEEARAEAKRCLQCKRPLCVAGCPVEIDIPGFVKALAEENPAKAIDILKASNNLPAVCGRVCPQEDQCELKCVLGKKGTPVAIGNLERYAADWEKRHHAELSPSPAVGVEGRGARVAVVGSGPASLTAAGDLARKGFDVTVFESLHEAGGVLRYGIPGFRLPSDVLDHELKSLEEHGVKTVLNCLVGRTKTIDDLFAEGFKAVFLGTGAGLPNFLNIPGENLNNIFSVNEFLVRVNLMRSHEFPQSDTPLTIGETVAVIGGGNTAMDAARTAVRLGAETVTLIYRRSENEMPARRDEIAHAKEEGVRFELLANPMQFTGDAKGFVQAVECVRMELEEPDESGRRRPRAVPGSNFTVPAETVIEAVGLSPNPVLPSLTKGLKTDDKGHLVIDERYMTSIVGVFAGGDIVGGETVIEAMGMGKRAARAISDFLKSEIESKK